MIVRVFRAVIRDGKQGEFEKFLVGKALSNVRAQPGLVTVTVGRPSSISPNEFTMIMVWKDLDSLKAYSGEKWFEAVIDPDEIDLLTETFVHHYELIDT